MTIIEEIRKEAFNLMPNGVFTEENQVCKLCERAINRGIQMERERLRKQIKKREYCIEGENDSGLIVVINKEDIDIWDDVK